jgi:hypothetical protein
VPAYTPPGWPAGVHPPGSEEFESTAVAWLLDVVPPDYRLHGVLRRYPIALAALARYHSKACVEGARQGYRAARTELDALPPHAIDSVLAAYRKEGARLAATARAVGLVERALRGETFTPKMPHEGVPTGQPARGRASTPKMPLEGVPTGQPARGRASTPEMPDEGVPTGRPPRGRASTPEMPDEGAQTEQPQPGEPQGKPQQGKPQQAPRAAEPQQSTRTGQPRRGNKIKS